MQMTETKSSPAPQPVRAPNADERKQLAAWLESQGYEPEDALGTAEDNYVAVFEHYISGGPGYAGKVMTVVWDGAPSFFDVFIWEDGKMVRSGREYDENECYRCGAKHGTLCVSCWRQQSLRHGYLSA